VSNLSWKWVWMTGLIAAAIASYGVLIRSPDGEVPSAERPVQPGYYLTGATLTITHPDGSERMKLIADRIEEHVADKSYAVQGVHMDYRTAPGGPWTLSADTAAVPADLATVEFNGNVEVRGGAAKESGVIRTAALTLDMTHNVAHTARPVTIEFAGQRLNATGLRADLTHESLLLESGVNGRFE
jgi:LPS export ABC transporter protein LptC